MKEGRGNLFNGSGQGSSTDVDYYWEQSTLSERQLNNMKLEIKAIRQLVDMNDVEDLLVSVLEYIG